MKRWQVGVIGRRWISYGRDNPVPLWGDSPPDYGAVLVEEGQHDPEAREALRELYEAVFGSKHSPYLSARLARRRAAKEHAEQVLGIPERCKECGQELPTEKEQPCPNPK